MWFIACLGRPPTPLDFMHYLNISCEKPIFTRSWRAIIMVSSRTLDIARDWKESPYYDRAEQDDRLKGFWKPGKDFRRLFDQLDMSAIVELACGHGRHSARLLKIKAIPAELRSLILLDVVEENVLYCKQRFADFPIVSVYANNGYDFRPLEDQSASSIFCYDAMVHFEFDAVISYIQDAFRVLRPGGRALFHHSNLGSRPGFDYKDNPGWRNFMSRNLFAHAAVRAELQVLEQTILDWDYEYNLDCLTLVEKPVSVSHAILPREIKVTHGSHRVFLYRIARKIRSVASRSVTAITRRHF